MNVSENIVKRLAIYFKRILQQLLKSQHSLLISGPNNKHTLFVYNYLREAGYLQVEGFKVGKVEEFDLFAGTLAKPEYIVTYRRTPALIHSSLDELSRLIALTYDFVTPTVQLVQLAIKYYPNTLPEAVHTFLLDDQLKYKIVSALGAAHVLNLSQLPKLHLDFWIRLVHEFTEIDWLVEPTDAVKHQLCRVLGFELKP